MEVNDKMYKQFINVMKDCGEPVFGNKQQIKSQLELCLTHQGYWSGVNYRIYYDNDKFRVEYKYYC